MTRTQGIRIGFEVESTLLRFSSTGKLVLRKSSNTNRYSNEYGNWGFDGNGNVSEYRTPVYCLWEYGSLSEAMDYIVNNELKKCFGMVNRRKQIPLLRAELFTSGIHVSISGIDIEYEFMERIRRIASLFSISLFTRKGSQYDCNERIFIENDGRYEFRILPAFMAMNPDVLSEVFKLFVIMCVEKSEEAIFDIIEKTMIFRDACVATGISKKIIPNPSMVDYGIIVDMYRNIEASSDCKNVVIYKPEGLNMPIYEE